MRKLVVLGVFFSWVLVAMAGDKVQPLNIKTGLWQVTITSAVSGRPPVPADVLARMSPEQRARYEAAMKKMVSAAPKTTTHNNCVTKEQLNKDPFSDEKKSCTRTVLKSTGSRMEIREVCEGNGVKSDITIQIEALNSENVKGVGHVTAAGGDKSMNINTNFTGKWIGAVCTDKK
ncbi:MAG: DUF3617 domain-containing protein [Acidobacteriia bacterium]|nr:DUF3617 domain-containing protein [Terriglobia bacterium]